MFKIGEDYIKGVVKVSSENNFYIQVTRDIGKLNKLCSMTVEQLTKKFAGSPKHILIAESKEKLKEMLDFINTLSSTQSISESDINSLNKEPLNQNC